MNSSKFRSILICTVTVVLFLFNSQYLFAYEKEIKDISSTITESIAKSGKKTIAVVDFTDLQGNITELGRFLAEELSVDLTTTAGGFEVIDRTHLKSILAEHKLSISGLVDPKTVKRLGEIAGVDAIITGSVTPFGDSIRLAAKVIVTDTAKVIGASKCDIAKTKAIEELLSRGIEAQSFSQQASASGYVPSSQSKKVGPFVVTMKKIIVAPEGQVRVILDFYNQSDKYFPMRNAHSDPKLTDENGNIYKYEEGDIRSHQLILNPKSNSNVALYFEPKGRGGRNINIGDKRGTYFAVNIPFLLRDSRNDTIEYNVSFTDIKAQMPK